MLGSCFCENRALAGLELCCFFSSLLFEGLLGGNGTRALLSGAALQTSAPHKVRKAARVLYVAVFSTTVVRSMLPFSVIATFAIFLSHAFSVALGATIQLAVHAAGTFELSTTLLAL